MSNRATQASLMELLRRLRWDFQDEHERRAWTYQFMWQIPGSFGDGLRSRYVQRHAMAVGGNLRVLAGCRFRSLEKLELGDDVTIGHDNFLQARGGLKIGSRVVTEVGVKIWSVNHDYSDASASIAEQGQTEKAVTIGDGVHIGAGAFILPGVRLPEECVVHAGAIVGVRAFSRGSIISGNPARVVGFRQGYEASV